jgi:hypothetical protein
LVSVERSVEEVLLPSLEDIAARRGGDSAAWAFAAGWGADWLRRAQRLTPCPMRGSAIVIGDASRDELDRDFLHIRALELFCVRAGVQVLSLSARGTIGLADVLAAHPPNLVVLAGRHLDDDGMARWAYQARLATGSLPVALYRRGDGRIRVRATGTSVLPEAAGDAQRTLLDLLDADSEQRNQSPAIPREQAEPVEQGQDRRSA